MGVLNVTPDSFSDGGQFLEFDSALAHAREMAEQGAQIIDIGGESTRPGSMRVSLDEEQQRVLPVIRAIKEELKVKVSIDTMNADTAAKAISAGADIVNDVSGGLADPQIFAAVADSDCNYVLGHWRGHSDIMDSLTTYSDVAREVVAELAEQVSMAVAAGIARERIVVDPGLGFAKDMKQKPVYNLGTGEGAETTMVSQMKDFTSSQAFRLSGGEAWRTSGISHDEVDHLMIYDAFAHLPLYGLEDLGFCKRGEAADFVWERNTAPGGKLPMNTNGGGLSYMHSGTYGMYALQESIRQMRGVSPAQVPDAQISFCHGVGCMFAASGTVVFTNQEQ